MNTEIQPNTPAFPTPSSPASAVSPWLTVREATRRVGGKCGPKLLYQEVRAGRLRAAKIGGRRELRFLPEWIDTWLVESSKASTPKAA